MSRSHRAEYGSIAAAVIVILVVTLCATLGILFYQNFIARPVTAPAPNISSSESSSPRQKEVAFGSTIYELQFPANGWTSSTVAIEGSKAGGSDTYFDNLDGTLRVHFGLSESGANGTCVQDDKRKIGYYSVDPTVNTTLAGESVYLTEAIFDAASGGYQYKIGLTPDGGATHAATGQSYCNVATVGTIPSIKDGDVIKRPVVTAEIFLLKLDKQYGQKIPEMQNVKDVLATDAYRQAKAILLSARKK